MRAFLVLVSFMAIGCPIASDAGNGSSLEDEYVRFRSVESSIVEMPGKEKSEAISSAFQTTFGHRLDDPENLDDRALTLGFNAVFSTAFYTRSEKYAAVVLELYDELDRRGLSNPVILGDAYSTLVATRRLAEAERLAKMHPDVWLEPMPRVIEDQTLGAGPSVWIPDSEGAVRHAGLSLKKEQVVVAAHPLCHFTQSAVHDIAADSGLHALFRAYAVWIAPQSGQLELDAFREWNGQHPDMPMAIAYKQDEWPLIDSWSTPTFYFFKDGALVDTVVGWPREGHRDQLLAGFRKLGVRIDEIDEQEQQGRSAAR